MSVHLCFHGVGVCRREREPGEARYWVGATTFREILDVVAGRDDVTLSFDDGNMSDATVALPELQRRELTATFFALAGRLDDPDSLRAADLRALRREGMTIGSHGWAHVPWRALGEADMRREFDDARTALAEAAGTTIDTAAAPLGRYDRRVLRRLKSLGYRAVYTSDRYRSRPGAWLQARYSMTAEDTADSVRALLDAPWRGRELRNVAVSALKRLR